MRPLIILLFSVVLSLSLQGQNNSSFINPIPFSIEKLEKQRGIINYSLNEIVGLIHESVEQHNQIHLPKGLTEFERLLFTARRIQHNDSQLTAISIYQHLLTFQYYRTKGEKLYIKYLLSKSLDYIGASYMAYQSMKEVFPEFTAHLNQPKMQAFYLGQYAGLLFKLDSLNTALQEFKKVLSIAKFAKDTSKIVNQNNNVGFTFLKMQEYDSTKVYFKINQNPSFRSINPVIHAFSYGNYGAVLQQEKQYDSALFYLKIEERLLQNIGSLVGVSNLYNSIADCYSQLGSKDSAIFFYTKSMEIGKSRADLKSVEYSLEKLIELQLKEPRYKELKVFIDEYEQLRDSLTNQLQKKSLKDEIRTKEFFNIYSEIDLNKDKYDLLRRNNTDLLKIITGLSALILLSIGLIIYRHRSRKKLNATNIILSERNKRLNEINMQLQESSRKNEILLKELHHRVKNNLQMIISLFNLQLNAGEPDDRTEEVFKIAKDRIHSIALIHKTIYQSELAAEVNFKEYIKTFVDEIVRVQGDNIEVSYIVGEFYLSIDSAVPLGLIINELFTNSIKHAKPKNKLKVIIEQQKDAEGFLFTYKDNGQIFDVNKVNAEGLNSVGITLIKLLAEQLEAEAKFEAVANDEYGFKFVLQGKLD